MAKTTRRRVPKMAPAGGGMLAAAVEQAGAASAADSPPTDGAPPNLEKLQALATALLKTRDEAISGRTACGIEDIWREDEEHYEGYDELNKNTTTSTSQTKPPGQLPANVAYNQATEFPNITRPYTDAAAAKVADILIPADEKGWKIKAVAIPELEEKAEGKLPIDVIAGMGAANVPENIAVQIPQIEAASAQAMIAESEKRAERAECRIEEWQVEGQYHAEMRKVIEMAARLGTGILKGPVPAKKKQQMYAQNALVIEEVVKPVSRSIHPRNCFPDPACGESIHNGRYHWERDHLTPKQLEALKGTEGYIDAQIDQCIAEGPQKKLKTEESADGRKIDDKGLFEVWYFYGYATQDDMMAAGCPCSQAAALIPAIFTMVNERVVKGAVNPLDTGEFPYDYFPWSRRDNMPWGFGVPRQIRTAQRIVTAATRTMLTNAGRAAGPIFLMRRKVIGADGTNNIVPWKVFYAPEADVPGDVGDLLKVYEIPDRQQSLQAIIQYGLKIAEDTTGLPLLLQGQNGNAPDTLGGQLLVDRNASTVLRRIARTVDDCLTEPHIRRYYTYLLMYGDDDFEKGEFVIDAKGSTALVEREINREEATAMLKLSLDPRFGIDPKKAMIEKLRSDKRNPQDFLYSPEDQKKIDSQQAPPAPAVEVAQINAASREKIAAAEIQTESAEKQKDRDLTLIEQQVLERIEAMKVDGAKEETIEELKAMLASVTMKLRTQDNLSARNTALALHKHHVPTPAPPALTPPTEPAGRAQPGQSFSQ